MSTLQRCTARLGLVFSVFVLSLALVACGSQASVRLAQAPPKPTQPPFVSATRDCMAELAIPATGLDEPNGLLLRQVGLQGMGLYERQLLHEYAVGDGWMRAVRWWFYPSENTPTAPAEGEFYTLDGRFEADRCTIWTIPAPLSAQITAAGNDPAYQALRPADVQPEVTCPDSGGFVLISATKELYVTECPIEHPALLPLFTLLQHAQGYGPAWPWSEP